MLAIEEVLVESGATSPGRFPATSSAQNEFGRPSGGALTMLRNIVGRKTEQSAARKSRQATTLQSGHPARRA